MEVRKGSRINVEFTVMDIEYDQTCMYDWVQVEDSDGQELSIQRMWLDFTFNQLKKSLAGPTKFFIHFHSDGSITSKGFSAKLTEITQI